MPPNADERQIAHMRDRLENEMNIFLADADRALGQGQADDTAQFICEAGVDMTVFKYSSADEKMPLMNIQGL